MPYVTSIERLEREEALLEGERIGERKGERKGERSGLMAGIEALLKVKFGTAGSQCMAAIRLIEDVALLQTILRTTESATSLDELCPLWS